MSSTNTAEDELRERLTKFCKGSFPDTENVKNLLTKVSESLRCELLSSITDSVSHTVLTRAAYRGHTELCVTLLSSLPPADRLKLILIDKPIALHWAAYRGYIETVSGIMDCLTADQQPQLLFTQDIKGVTALHWAASKGHTEAVKTMLDNLTPEQQLQLLSVKDNGGNTASREAERYDGTSYTKRTLEQYQMDADFGVNFRKFAKFIAEISTIQIISASLHDYIAG